MSERSPCSWKQWLWLLPLVLLAGLWALPQLVRGQPAHEEHEEHAEALPVELTAADVVTVSAQPLPATVQATGTLEPLPDGRGMVAAEVPGRVLAFRLKPGDRVAAGQVVARIQRDDLEAAVREKQAGAAEARRQFTAIEAKVPLQESSLEAQLQFAGAAESSARARLERLRAGNRPEEIEQAEAQAASAEADLDRLRSGPLPQERRQAEAALRETRAEVEVAGKAAARAARLVEQGIAAARERERADADLARAREKQAAAEEALALVNQGTRPELIRAQEQKVREFQAHVRLLRLGSRPEEIREAEAGVEEARAKRAEIEAGRRQVAILRADAAAARQRQRQAEAALHAAYAVERQTVVRSPISGLVSKVSVTTGEVVQAGRTLAELESDTALRLLLEVPAAHQGALRPGLTVAVSLPHQPEVRYSGTVRVIAPAGNPETGTVTAEVWLPNARRSLRAGLVVNGELHLGRARPVPVVPAGSVFATNGEQYVWKLGPDKKVHQQRVTLGTGRAEEVQVLDGIRAGERIVRDGRRSIADETPYTLAEGGR